MAIEVHVHIIAQQPSNPQKWAIPAEFQGRFCTPITIFDMGTLLSWSLGASFPNNRMRMAVLLRKAFPPPRPPGSSFQIYVLSGLCPFHHLYIPITREKRCTYALSRNPISAKPTDVVAHLTSGDRRKSQRSSYQPSSYKVVHINVLTTSLIQHPLSNVPHLTSLTQRPPYNVLLIMFPI